jgi:hypothetical protein
VEERTEKMKSFIGGVEALIALEKEMKENKYVLNLIKLERSVQIVVT